MMNLQSVETCAKYLYNMSIIGAHAKAINDIQYSGGLLSSGEMAMVNNSYCRIVHQHRFDSLRAYVMYCGNVFRASMKLSLNFFRSRR
jgi:hypothetical protein